jgi:hypothetical protein
MTRFRSIARDDGISNDSLPTCVTYALMKKRYQWLSEYASVEKTQI